MLAGRRRRARTWSSKARAGPISHRGDGTVFCWEVCTCASKNPPNVWLRKSVHILESMRVCACTRRPPHVRAALLFKGLELDGYDEAMRPFTSGVRKGQFWDYPITVQLSGLAAGVQHGMLDFTQTHDWGINFTCTTYGCTGEVRSSTGAMAPGHGTGHGHGTGVNGNSDTLIPKGTLAIVLHSKGSA